MKETKISVIAAVALGAAMMLPMAAEATVTLYVGGENASDDNSGTSTSAPLATIDKAMDRVNGVGSVLRIPDNPKAGVCVQ